MRRFLFIALAAMCFIMALCFPANAMSSGGYRNNNIASSPPPPPNSIIRPAVQPKNVTGSFLVSDNKFVVHRLYNGKDHFYTANFAEVESAKTRSGYKSEGECGKVLGEQVPGSTPLYRMYNGTDHFYTASHAEAQAVFSGAKYRFENVSGFVFASPKSGTKPVYRLYNGTDHFYTMSSHERDVASRSGYKSEGIGFYTYE